MPSPKDGAGAATPGGKMNNMKAQLKQPAVQVLAGCGFILFVYVCVGMHFLQADKDVHDGCKPSNEDVHVIWNTSLYGYVCTSLVFAILAMLLIAFPLRANLVASVDGLRPAKKENVQAANAQRDSKGRLIKRPESVKELILPNLSDWLYLCMGSALLFHSVITLMLAYWGYTELFLARPWCEDKEVAFEELNLWGFGRFTFVMQIVLGIFSASWGIFYWFLPFGLQLKEQIFPSKGENQPLRDKKSSKKESVLPK